ncbi:MAG TPA: cysteine--tRNA ligase [Myxococcota bacterium]|nr:cysteine--tRNA ligase [Myxococcota bacterium]HRY96309.1 cysteine--tRNA ligase [Myxococcota bacterium]HSA20809.1 cysteine--tRNA ligase [Myxococcota bacterium]
MTLHVWNSLSNMKEEFRPLVPGRVGMYVCGVTVYDMCHVGHARAYVTADVVYRYLRHLGLEVTYVRNFTDVDDKIIRRANELGVSSRELADRFIREFHVDMDALGILRPQIEPRVTEHIPDIIHTVEALVAREHAYVVDGDVYFDVGSFAPYGKLSKRNLEDLRSGARVEVDERKRSPLDFALWKTSKPGEPSWPSPWGAGRPGWHIECSTMSTKYLGETFDLHGGGKDLVFPHHENEIAQSEAATGKPFARVFVHNGFVNIDKEKMSKSLNNFFTIREMTGRYTPEALRYFLLGTHYRSPINFDVLFVCPACQASLARADVEGRRCPACGAGLDEAQARAAVQFPSLEEAQRRLQYLYTTFQRLLLALGQGLTGAGEILRAPEVDGLLPRFREAMDDDFNAAVGLAVLADATRLVNEVLDNKEGHAAGLVTSTAQRLREAIDTMGEVLGILRCPPEDALCCLRDRCLACRGLDAAAIDRLVEERTAARKAKDFARADALRKQLGELGVELMDSGKGTSWKMK